ncbi:hydroxymethylpyrimidine/phosphomethylpyrimidine kinase [Flavobacterium gillisiae]|uniref:hydroxymethylpyrimidine kinase n=1 Tax=Flavobacterium gillisiae TaxID=150146 RepID=A0A1H3WII4_9FLAO|nr:hydroxymethylpyrimidine/phosphomethylpyrimidine kinase [Flavobacterium gillisiae]SDZ86929.1 hydroxymethylpyrimidine/phosphomethylpyrimidine kinase [Flavobacterium gillisiae]
MSKNRPFVLSIAGFDPSGGAGVLADCKTFEQHQVYGFAIITANTIQTENEFAKIEWTDLNFVLESVEKLFANYTIKAVKIGIVPSLHYLNELVSIIKSLSPETTIIWDTILKSSTGFDFLATENQVLLTEILQQVDLITPNYNEIVKLATSSATADKIAENLSQYCSVLLKGGHNPVAIGIDYLHIEDRFFRLKPTNVLAFEKHGSGCVLSASIVANIALDQNILTACKNAKIYIENYLLSNHTKLGYHYV